MKSLKEYREENELTQEELARLSNIPYSTYRKKEKGTRKWYIHELLRVCEVLKISVYDVKI